MQHNLKALEAVWDYSYDKVGYLGTNIPIDHCYECDYDGDFEATEKDLNARTVAMIILKQLMSLNEHVVT